MSMRRRVSFQTYLHRRGYDLRAGSGAFLWRLFIKSWAEPGFHRFWRVWNPGYGYALFHLYLLLGGNKRRFTATIGVFAFCGFSFHDLVAYLISGRFGLSCTFAFILYALLSLAAFRFERGLGQRRWPVAANAMLNLSGRCWRPPCWVRTESNVVEIHVRG